MPLEMLSIYHVQEVMWPQCLNILFCLFWVNVLFYWELSLIKLNAGLRIISDVWEVAEQNNIGVRDI